MYLHEKKFLLLLGFCIFLCQTVCGSPNYANEQNWAYWRQGENKQADVFLICPTVDLGSAERLNMNLEDTNTKVKFLGALNMEKGIYDEHCRLYAPFYRQGTLYAYTLPEKEQGAPFSLAYEDVKAAFQYYLRHENYNRPFILAGFSQGADMCIRLLKEFGNRWQVKDNLVACYAIGWRLEKRDVQRFPYLQPAQLRTDVGVIITFNTEAPQITSSLMVPANTQNYAINPLNWRNTGKPAPKELHLGACFTDYNGNIYREIPAFTGGYLAFDRGVMKLPNVNQEEYPPVLDIFDEGIFHIYDYQFFYRNLQQNVGARLKAFALYQNISAQAEAAQN